MTEPQPLDLPSAEQLDALAEILGNTLPQGLAEIERLGNPGGINLKDYTLGCLSLIATIRQMGTILAAGGDVFTDVPTAEEMDQTLGDLMDGLTQKLEGR